MPEWPDDKDRQMLELMGELEQLEAEQRVLDLRDPAAIDRHQQRIDSLRQRIQRLTSPTDNRMKSLARAGGSG